MSTTTFRAGHQPSFGISPKLRRLSRPALRPRLRIHDPRDPEGRHLLALAVAAISGRLRRSTARQPRLTGG